MSNDRASWYDFLKEAFEDTGDNFAEMITTLSKEERYKNFNRGYGGSEGLPFTAWGQKYVYFPVVYDGSEWVGWAPRDPCDEKTDHVGGQ